MSARYEPDRPGPPTRGEMLELATVLAVALAARVLRLDASLWYDEVFTLTHFVRLPWNELLRSFSSLNNHMLYSLEAKAAVRVLGESAWALRLPAVLFGLGSIVVAWQMARAAAGRDAALLAALLLALSYHHVWFSQNARGYTELLFWTALATRSFVAGLERPRPSTWTGYGLCFAAAMYTHLSAAFFLIAHAVVYGVLLMRRPAQLRHPRVATALPLYGFGLGAVVSLALYAPLVMTIAGTLGRVAARSAAGASTMPEWNDPARTLAEIAGSFGELGILTPVALAAGVVLVVLGAAAMVRRAPLLVAVYAVHVPLSLLLLWGLGFRIWPRYFFVDIGFVFTCAAAGIAACSRRFATGRWRPEPLFALAAVIAVAASLPILARNYAHPKQDLAGAVALVERLRAPGEVTTSTGLAAEPLHAYFAPAWPVVTAAPELQAFLASAPRVWLVTAFEGHARRRRPDVMALVQERFDLVARLPGTLGDGTVRVYRSR